MKPENMITETWGILDSSKLSDFMSCDRYYFYRHMLGWVNETKNQNLTFGRAWHAAMESLLLATPRRIRATSDVTREAIKVDHIEEAFQVFTKVYREDFGAETDLDYEPKSPGNALQALHDYLHYYPVDDFETLFTEVLATVPISLDGEGGDKK